MRRLGKTIVTWVLFWLTRCTLWRFHPEVIGIVGTTNKTTVKNALRALLPKTDEIRANPKSYNTEIGLPLAVLAVDGGGSSSIRWFFVVLRAFLKTLFSLNFPKLLILELGVDRIGDMAYLLQIVRVRTLLVTQILGESTLSNDADVRTVSAEIALAIERLPKEGTLIMNGDDRVSQALAMKSPCPVLWYGMGPKNMFRLYDIVETDDGSEAKIINTRTGKGTPIHLSVYGQHHLLAAAAAHAAYDAINGSRWIKKTMEI